MSSHSTPAILYIDNYVVDVQFASSEVLFDVADSDADKILAGEAPEDYCRMTLSDMSHPIVIPHKRRRELK